MRTIALAVVAAMVAFAFAAVTLERWMLRRRTPDVAWTTAMTLFGIGAASLAWGSATGWTSLSFRLFYAAGAVANVPFLAAGQLRIQLVRRRGRFALPSAALFGAFGAGVVLAAPLRGHLPAGRLPKGSEVFGPAPRVLAAVGSGVGAAIVFVGTAAAAIAHARTRAARGGPGRSGRRTLGFGLLALGTLVLSLSGTLNAVLGEMDAFSVTLTTGVCVLFAGFLLSLA